MTELPPPPKRKKNPTPRRKRRYKDPEMERKSSPAQKLEALKKKKKAAKLRAANAEKEIHKLQTKVVGNEYDYEEVKRMEEDENTEIIFKPNPGPQEDFLAATEDEVFYGGARGGGKRVAINTLVHTPTGSKKIGDVVEEDLLLNPEGGFSKVTHAHPIVEEEVYELHFDTGEVIEACKDHQWYGAWRDDKQSPYKTWDNPLCVKTTQEIYTHYKGSAKKLKKFKVPLPSPLEFEEKDLPIDPYVLGCLLGDGTICEGKIKHTSHEEDVDHFSSEYEKAGFSEVSLYYIKGNTFDLAFVGEDRLRLVTSLHDLGYRGEKSDTKFIPEMYFTGSVDQRRALLQGLLDTDGSVEEAKEGRASRIKYWTISDRLAEGFTRLAQSLGYRVRKQLRPPRYRDEYLCRPCWQIEIRGKDQKNAFRLPRKRDKVSDLPKTWKPAVTLEKIVKTDRKTKMRCLTVDHPNQLYIIGETYIVTHNTYSLIVDPLRYCTNGNFRALLVRRTTGELRDIEIETNKIYPKVFKGAKYKASERRWVFPSGAIIEFGYGENLMDLERYRGRAFAWIGVDELPQYEGIECYNLLKSCNRTTDPTLPTVMRCTGNPGSKGSFWVKQKFIDPAPENTTFYEEYDVYDPRTQQMRQVKRSLRYIPASVYDNPTLVNDDQYISNLASLPEVQRRQMLYGDWDVIEDSAFPDFRKDVHVIEPFEIPRDWLRFRAADWGFNSPFCCLWFAVDYDDNIYVYREFYGTKVIADDWAKEVARRERGEKIHYGVLDGSTDQSRGDRGPSIFETINRELRNHYSVPFRFADRSPGSRAAGKLEVHKRLALRETGLITEEGAREEMPSLLIFSNCTNLIRTLPSLPCDPNDPEKVAKKGAEDHAFDALQYGLRSRPMSPLQMLRNEAFSNKQKFTPVDETFGY